MTLEKNTSVFTVCNVAYLDKAMVLAESIYETNGIKLNVFVFDKKRVIKLFNFCNIIWIEDIEIPNFESLSFKYTIIELTTSFKPFLALYLLKKYSKVIFFDPDVMVFNSLSSIVNQLDFYPVLLTPHYFNPNLNGAINDERLMRFGMYNLGFFAVNNKVESFNFLSWWSERCFLNGFDDAQFGIFTDQKWVNIAPCFFPFLHTCYHSGYNVAYWNLKERTLLKNINGSYVINNEDSLIFFHFSSFEYLNPGKLSKHDFELGNNNLNDISEFGKMYFKEILKFENIAEDSNYSYEYMSNNKYISPTLRRAYASIVSELPIHHNPFDSNGAVYMFAKKNYLFQKDNFKYKAEGYSDINNHAFKFKIIYILLRKILFIIGPNKFMNLSKLLIFLSGYNKNSGMWKI